MAYFTNSPDEAESAFYAAFTHLDLELMRSVWYPDDSIFCIHPGGPAQTGYESVLKHWAFILDDVQPPKLNYQVIRKIQHETMATHQVEESVSSGADTVTVLATNSNINTEQGWRL